MVTRSAAQPVPRAPDQYDQYDQQVTRETIERTLQQLKRVVDNVTGTVSTIDYVDTSFAESAVYIALRSSIPAATIAASVNVIRTVGRANLFDRGGAIRVRGTASGIDPVQSADGAYWEIWDDKIKPEMFGATTASSDNSTAFEDAQDAAIALGVWLEVSEGTWRAAWQIAEDLKMRGAGRDRTIIKRPLAHTGNYVVSPLGNKNVTIWDISVDGDKANNSNAANCMVFTGGNYDVRRVRAINAKDSAGSYGGGIILASSTDVADGTRSIFEDCEGFTCDAHGVAAFDSKSFDFIRPRGVACKYGVYVGSVVTPTSVNAANRIFVQNAFAEFCTTGNCVFESRLTDSAGDIDVVSHVIYEMIIDGAIGNDGATNGVVVQGAYIMATNLQGHRNTLEGVLVNVIYSSVKNVAANDNGDFGVDAGYSSKSILDGIIATNNTGIGLNGGGGLGFRIKNFHLSGNGINAYLEKYEASPPYGSPIEGDEILIEDGYIECTGSAPGLLVGGGLRGRARNVRVAGAISEQAFNIQSHLFTLDGCTNVDQDYTHKSAVSAAASTLVLSETQDNVIVTGSGASISLMLTQNQIDFEGCVAFIDVTNPGSGYTSAPTLDFSAGTGGSGAAATILLTPSGKTACPRMTNYGDGLYSDTTFAVTASGGGGSGFAATAYVGLRPRTDGRRLALYFQDANTIVHGTGNINTATGKNYTTKAGETVRFLSLGGTWVQEGQGLIKLGPSSDLTIASGAVTATGNYHQIDTEAAAASDDLDTINWSGADGALLVVRAKNSTRDVVAKDGTGNLNLAGDFTMDHSRDTLTLLWVAGISGWIEISRSDNST